MSDDIKEKKLATLDKEIKNAQDRAKNYVALAEKLLKKKAILENPILGISTQQKSRRYELIANAALKMMAADENLKVAIRPYLEAEVRDEFEKWLVGLLKDKPKRKRYGKKKQGGVAADAQATQTKPATETAAQSQPPEPAKQTVVPDKLAESLKQYEYFGRTGDGVFTKRAPNDVVQHKLFDNEIEWLKTHGVDVVEEIKKKGKCLNPFFEDTRPQQGAGVL